MTTPATTIRGGPVITPNMARELAIKEKVCVRPLMRRVDDRQHGTSEIVAIPCGSTRETVCPPCAQKAKALRMLQCREGWHRTDEPERPTDLDDQVDADEDQADLDELPDDLGDDSRRVRSTRRRQDAPDLPRVPRDDRTVGRMFLGRDGKEYRPSMFLTLTMPSYGPVLAGRGVPVDLDQYDYRRQALDALHFPKLVDRFWQNLRRVAGYNVQYFSTVEPQKRLAPHLHAALRGAIPRHVLREVAAATYAQLWWPQFDRPVYVLDLPVWNGTAYLDPHTNTPLPTWEQALDELGADPDARPAHVVRFGTQVDIAGILPGTPDADRTVRYLTKYLTKDIARTYGGPDDELPDPAYLRHANRLHAELRWLPCSEGCANWLLYGVQPANPGPGLVPGRCVGKAHDRENLGLGGRRVLVSRQWSGKTLGEHRVDRATVVHQALLAAGIVAPETERMAATVTLPDGTPRFVWTDTRPDIHTYATVLLRTIDERLQWRQEYERAKTLLRPVDGCSATGPPPGTPHSSASPDPRQNLVAGLVVRGERSESAGHEAQRSALDHQTGDHILPRSGEAETHTQRKPEDHPESEGT